MLEQVEIETTRYKSLPMPVKAIFLILSTAGIGLAIFYLFAFTIKGKALLDAGYYFLIMAIYSSCALLVLPARKGVKGIPWYDLILSFLSFGICFYFFLHAEEIVRVGWTHPSTLNFILAVILWLLILEGGRRIGGFAYLVVCLILGLYPLFAPHMPGIFWGFGKPFVANIGSMVFTEAGLIGLPSKVLGEILIGFLLFAAVLIATGAGRFFLNIALAICGGYRGGPAKVAVISSGFFGSLSGSVFANIVATGSVTIPAMKRLGYPPHYAGAIEACASTGGVLMPPVMGAVAFVMCQFLGISYATVLVAAVIPAVLYYLGLLLQVDAYAARTAMKGLPKEDLPPIKKTLKEGWHFIAVFVFLLWGLLYMRWEEMTPFYAVGVMLILSLFRKGTMMTPGRIAETLAQVGILISQTAAIIFPIGFVVAGLTVTGVSGSFAAGLVYLGGGNVYLTLIFGVFACYIMGMIGLSIVAYIFLAVTLAPAVMQMDQLNVIAVHLFIIYYSMLAAITPPVAAGAFLAAAIAGAPPMKTSFTAMRLGVVIYFIPFFFVFNPALVMQSTLFEALYYFAFCVLGIILLAAGMEGYLLKIGVLAGWARLLLVMGGFLITFPEWKTSLVGALLALIPIVTNLIRKARQINPASPASLKTPNS